MMQQWLLGLAMATLTLGYAGLIRLAVNPRGKHQLAMMALACLLPLGGCLVVGFLLSSFMGPLGGHDLASVELIVVEGSVLMVSVALVARYIIPR